MYDANPFITMGVISVFHILVIHSLSLLQAVTLVVERVSLNLPRVSLSADTSSSVSNHSNSSVTSLPKTNNRLSFSSSTPPNKTSERHRDYSFVTDGRQENSPLASTGGLLRHTYILGQCWEHRIVQWRKTFWQNVWNRKKNLQVKENFLLLEFNGWQQTSQVQSTVCVTAMQLLLSILCNEPTLP